MYSGFLSQTNVSSFENIIADYSPAQEVVDAFSEADFAVIAGPAASGKDTLREGLLQAYAEFYHKVFSLTTRPPRPDEENTYKFVSIDEMVKLAKQKKLLQLALVHNQQVSATDYSAVKDIPQGKIGLGILIVQAEQDLYKLKPDLKTIFLIPPSYGEFISRIKREGISTDDEISRRLASAKTEINIALNTGRYYMLVSDVRENVRLKADAFLRFDKRDEAEEKRAQSVCDEILNKLT